MTTDNIESVFVLINIAGETHPVLIKPETGFQILKLIHELEGEIKAVEKPLDGIVFTYPQ